MGDGSQGGFAQYKVVLLGEGAVGKTSILLRGVQNKFNPQHVSTLQASFLSKKYAIGDRNVELAIWDTAGQERFHALGPIYYRGSHAAILVYDITDQDSFRRVQNWVKELRRMLGNDVILLIAGNKADLERQRVVGADDAKRYAEEVGAIHFSTSAKQGEGVEDMFVYLANKLSRRKAPSGRQSQNANSASAAYSGAVIIASDADSDTFRSNKCNC